MDLSGHEGEIPIPITTTHVGGHGHGHVHTIIHGNPPISTVSSEDHHHHHHNHHYSKKGVVVKYRECLKNHAASLGGNATDGCGEFMPSGDEGTLEALRCSACSCHRNFHRREFEGEASPYGCLHHLKGRGVVGQKGFLISGQPPPPHHMIMPLGALQASESDEMEGGRVVVAGPPMVKKRFRTKFTAEQKEKMMGFAERVGWKLQKLEEGVVQQFCQEIGVRRRVLKVWMHNNKHSLAKKGSLKVE